MSELIYMGAPLSHPNRRVMDARVFAVNAIVTRLLLQGDLILSPITHGYPLAAHGLGTSWECFERLDLALLDRCDRLHILPFPGWHNRSWTPRTLGDLAASIAAEHGLTPAVSPALASHTLPHLDQADESNMNLLTRVAKSVGGIAKANDGKLIIVPQGEGKTISGKSMPTVSIVRTSGTSHSVKLIGRQDYKRVVSVWRDTNAAQDKEATAGEGEPVRRIRHVYPDQAAAEKAAQTSLEAYRRGKSTLSVSLPGRPELAAEGRLILSGFRSGVNGEWSITRVTHKLSAGGYVTDVEGEVPK